MSFGTPTEQHANLLLDLFKEKMVTELTDTAINAIRPAITTAAIAAVEGMQPAIAYHFDNLSRQTVLVLSGKEVMRTTGESQR